MRQEFKHGYAKTTDLQKLFAAKRSGGVGKNELRVFCARLESEESSGRYSLDWLVNRKVQRRFTSGQQANAAARLDAALADHESDKELTTKIPRRFLRAAARGRLNGSEIWAGLVYYSRRMPQRSRRSSLIRGERYARFTLEIARDLTSLARSTLSEAFQRLRQLKIISCVWRPMQEIKRFGLLYVDGPELSVSYAKDERSRARSRNEGLQNRETDSVKNTNAYHITTPNNSFKGFESLSDTLTRLRERFGASETPAGSH